MTRTSVSVPEVGFVSKMNRDMQSRSGSVDAIMRAAALSHDLGPWEPRI